MRTVAGMKRSWVGGLRFFRGLAGRHIVPLVFVLFLPGLLLAHDIPADTTVRVFVKPEGGRLRLLVRVQMASIQEIDWPVHKEDGTLDLAAIDPFLRQAANKWLGDKIEVYEEGTKIDSHSLVSARLSLEGDTSFATYEQAFAHLTGPPLALNTKLLPTQGMLDSYSSTRSSRIDRGFRFIPGSSSSG